jgi:hypothetical protein
VSREKVFVVKTNPLESGVAMGRIDACTCVAAIATRMAGVVSASGASRFSGTDLANNEDRLYRSLDRLLPHKEELEDEPLLAFYDTEGKRTLGLSGTVLALKQSNGKGKAGIYLSAGNPSIGPGGEERGGAALTFYDTDGKAAAGLSSTGVYFGARSGEGFPNRAEVNTNGFIFTNPDGKIVALLGGRRDISDQSTLPTLSLNGSEGEGPSINLFDKDGFQAAIGTIDLETPRTGETHRTSAASVMLLSKDKKVLWKAP